MTALERMAQAEDGTVVPLPGQPDVYAVRGRKSWYRCNAKTGGCSCSYWLYRRADTCTACRHLRALGEWLVLAALLELELAAQELAEAAPVEGPPLPSDDELRRLFA